jgi:hypothetical protein
MVNGRPWLATRSCSWTHFITRSLTSSDMDRPIPASATAGPVGVQRALLFLLRGEGEH